MAQVTGADEPTSDDIKTRLKPGQDARDYLTPGSDAHARVLQHLVQRIEYSERSMSKFYDRWRVNEAKYQAYITLPDYEQILKTMNDQSKAPQVVSICVPYAFATISTIVTYLLQAFVGRQPIFQVSSNNPDFTTNARNMERVLQYQAEHTRLVRHIARNLLDGQIYGVQIMKTYFENKTELRTQKASFSPTNFLGSLMGSRQIRQRVPQLVYSGNCCEAVDPFMFFPDPRVPMTEVNKRGEWTSWRSFEGRHTLKDLERQGIYKHVDSVQNQIPQNYNIGGGQSDRSLRSQGESNPGNTRDSQNGVKNFVQVDQGTFKIVPKDLGLGDESQIQTWIFTILNKSQIVQAQPYDADHGMHPVSVAEPYEFGYGFGNCGIADYLGPLQDTISWFINSHIYNVRAAMQNMLVVDPSMVEMQDVRNPDPGKLIRLKRAAYGQDVRQAISQLQVYDVTKAHVNDAQVFIKMGQYMTAVTDNVMGLQEEGGRKTAQEVRVTAQAGASRLAGMARLISAQQMVDLTTQMSLNTQQFLDDKFYYYITGPEGQKAPIKVGMGELLGDFNYPINDGTLPIDNQALLQVWKEIFAAVLQDQQLRSTYDIAEMFGFIAQLGGARNIDSFKIQMVPNAAPEAGGNVVPLNPQTTASLLPGGGPGGLTPPTM